MMFLVIIQQVAPLYFTQLTKIKLAVVSYTEQNAPELCQKSYDTDQSVLLKDVHEQSDLNVFARTLYK